MTARWFACVIGGSVLALVPRAFAQDPGAPVPVARFPESPPPATSAAGSAGPTPPPDSPSRVPAPSQPPASLPAPTPVVAAPPTRNDVLPLAPIGAPEAARYQFESPERRWYGWQTLLVDIPALSLWVGGAVASHPSGVVVGLGLVTYVLDAPIVHAAHGHLGKAAGSLGLRAGVVLLGIAGAAGCLQETVSFAGRQCGTGYSTLLVVGSLGIIAAVIVDAAVIAHEDVAPEKGGHTALGFWFPGRGPGGGLTYSGAF